MLFSVNLETKCNCGKAPEMKKEVIIVTISSFTKGMGLKKTITFYSKQTTHSNACLVEILLLPDLFSRYKYV